MTITLQKSRHKASITAFSQTYSGSGLSYAAKLELCSSRSKTRLGWAAVRVRSAALFNESREIAAVVFGEDFL